MHDLYKQSGVDLDKAREVKKKYETIVKSTFNENTISPLGLFGGFYELKDYKNPIIVSSTDGVGTKMVVSSFLEKHFNLGQDIVNHCINDVLTSGAKPLFFLDYIAVDTLVVEQAESLVAGMAESCRDSGCVLIGGETAQLSGVYQKGQFDIAGFLVGVVEKELLLEPTKVKKDDILIAVPSNGLHTNGYSLVRKVFDIDTNPGILNTIYDELGTTLGDVLSIPHRSYYPLLESVLSDIVAMAHITGGGLIENLMRVIPPGLSVKINYDSWKLEPIFNLIQSIGNVQKEEMWSVFNMGVGMVLITEEAKVSNVLNLINGSWILGKVIDE
jgi:phosphoribosylformylglycinamidine cyclo-ligase